MKNDQLRKDLGALMILLGAMEAAVAGGQPIAVIDPLSAAGVQPPVHETSPPQPTIKPYTGTSSARDFFPSDRGDLHR